MTGRFIEHLNMYAFKDLSDVRRPRATDNAVGVAVVAAVECVYLAGELYTQIRHIQIN